MCNVDHYAHALSVTDPLREPVIREAIRALGLPRGSRGLDAGCGIGLQALLLAEAVGPAGHVTALDVAPAFLDRGRALAARAGLAERIAFREGDVNHLPFDDDRFDWLWSADCAGYPATAPLALVKELARVVRPGGVVAILVWSSQMLLPGYPRLEARLNATTPGIAPFAGNMVPEQHPLRALGWFRDAGLAEPTARTFTGDACAPLTDDLRDALTALLEMRWPDVESELTAEDRAAYRRLVLPQSPDFILDRPDYYAFFTYSMFQGAVPRAGAVVSKWKSEATGVLNLAGGALTAWPSRTPRLCPAA